MKIVQRNRSPFVPVFEAIEAGLRKIKVSGLSRSAQAFLMACIANEGRSFCLVTAAYEQAERLFEEIEFFLEIGSDASPFVKSPLFFPPWDILPYEPSNPRPDRIARRLTSLHRMATSESACVVTTVDALLQKVVSSTFLLERTMTLRTGETRSRDALLEKLYQGGFDVCATVESPGEIAIRGGIIDLFPPTSNNPVRVEFDGDVIESIRDFEIDSQRSERQIDRIEIILGCENIFDANFYRVAVSEYFPKETLLILDEAENLRQIGKRTLEALKEASLFAARRNPNYPKMEDLYLPLSHIVNLAEGRITLDLETFLLHPEKGSKRFSFDTRSPAVLGLNRPGQSFLDACRKLEALRLESLVILALKNQNQLERFKRLLSDHELPWVMLSEWLGESADPPAPIYLTVGNLSEGFSLPDLRYVFLTEEALMGGNKSAVHHRPSLRPKKRTSQDVRAGFLASFDDLSVSDHVVHIEHGIGRYAGLKRLRVRQQERDRGYETDFMVLEYAGGDKVYVPLDSFNLVQRYIGMEGTLPKLDRLGGHRWVKAKEKVRKEIKEMTQDLLDLYAQREVAKGYPFEISTSDAEEFAASFDYDETPDQLRTIQEVKADMEKTKPMDRLVCGDVGYGKTEVAMRAAFQAIMNNKQVAVIVPTTLLAQQHHETFTERFSPFPVKVAALSRFRSPAEQKDILAGLKHGTVDILIGTHRLLQKDVCFRDLGLIVIDEEHRFGVRHKERLKQLRKEVDVLTLTATPIPRTLQMALSQIRNLSIIETPPADRLAIRTIMAPFDPTIIHEAVFRELVRSGQVFFLHNRIHNIDQIGKYLSELLPEAKIGIAHGQMSEKALEKVMFKFLKEEYNLLLTTTIIESGIDIPSANTIIINDAERFGLSELYQLRGRVGRSGKQAYAYLLVREERILTEAARKRLQAIQEFTELGSGFRIAARDLEIRGAGNLLGREQSGRIAAVGFEMYLDMINDMVKELKGTPIEKEIEPAIQFRVSAYMPEDYIPNAYQRLAIYKRLSSCGNLQDIEGIRDELEDRYGPLPEAVCRLLHIIQLKGMAKTLRICRLEQRTESVFIALDPGAGLPEDGLRRLLDTFRDKIHFDSPYSFKLALKSGSWEDIYLDTAHCLKVMQGGET